MNEIDKNSKLIIDVEKLFPEAARRVKILEDLQKSWAGVVSSPILARNSYPEVLGVDELQISTRNKNTADMLFKMKGNIIRKLKKKYNYEIHDNFKVKISIV